MAWCHLEIGPKAALQADACLRSCAHGERTNVPFQIAVHDGEEDLEKEVDGIYEDGEEV